MPEAVKIYSGKSIGYPWERERIEAREEEIG